MTLLAMLFMGAALTGVTALACWCYWRVLGRSGQVPQVRSDQGQ